METGNVQDIIIGSGTTQTPIPASESVPMAGQSKPARARKESHNSGNGMKPTTVAEALSLLQTDCFDLIQLGLTVILAENKSDLVIMLRLPDHKLDIKDGHIRIDGLPVLAEAAK